MDLLNTLRKSDNMIFTSTRLIISIIDEYTRKIFYFLYNLSLVFRSAISLHVNAAGLKSLATYMYMYIVSVLTAKALARLVDAQTRSSIDDTLNRLAIGVATITQLRTCVMKIVQIKGNHLMW